MGDLTEREAGILAVVRENDRVGVDRIVRECRIGRVHMKYERRSRKNLWGRFGGGWNWVLGVQWSRTTVIVNLLVASVRFSIRPRGGS